MQRTSIHILPLRQSDPDEYARYLKLAAVYSILAKHDPEQCDLVNRIVKEKALLDNLPYKKLLDAFLTKELVRWAMVDAIYSSDVRFKNRFYDLYNFLLQRLWIVFSNCITRLRCS